MAIERIVVIAMLRLSVAEVRERNQSISRTRHNLIKTTMIQKYDRKDKIIL